MKVLFLNSCVHGGGAGRSLATFLKHKSTNIQATIVVPESGIMAKEFSPHADLIYMPEFIERIHRSPYKFARNIKSGFFHIVLNSWGMAVCMIKMWRLAAKLKPDVIYANHMLAKPFGVFAGSMLGIPVILHVRNIHYTKFGSAFYRFLARRKIVKQLVCNSYASSRVFEKEVPEKISIVYNSIDDHTFLKPEFHAEKTSSTITFGFVGRIVPWKGLNVLLDAFALLAKEHDNIRLVVVGENDKGLHRDLEQESKDFCKKNHIADKVEFLGFKKDVREGLKKMDVLMLPSVAPEPFGRVIIEAMAFKIPSIITAHGGSIEIIEPYKNGLWCTPGDPLSMSNAMKYFCHFPEQIQTMGDYGYEKLKEMFLSSSQSQKMNHIILNHNNSEQVQTANLPKEKLQHVIDFYNSPERFLESAQIKN
ncbi:MAG: glycosyltransferase family 4 protein [Proteobacteria bacterium]|nr:glycosyltransferase family 4 protein [Pseudomonadota bacterium]